MKTTSERRLFTLRPSFFFNEIFKCAINKNGYWYNFILQEKLMRENERFERICYK